METAEQVLNAIRLELAKWQDHAVRGMKSGNTAYHQGKITLITDLFAFIHELDSQEPETVTFRLKCEPRIVVTVPAEIVHEEGDAWCLVFVNENQCLQTMVLLFREWTKEG